MIVKVFGREYESIYITNLSLSFVDPINIILCVLRQYGADIEIDFHTQLCGVGHI